jgi:hypothetical protein
MKRQVLILKKNKCFFQASKFDFNLRPYFYIFAARSAKNAGVAQLVRALDS